MWVVPLFVKLERFAWKCHPRTDVNRKPQRWLHVDGVNLEKVTVQDFECQVVIENRNLKDAETQTEISIALSSPANSGSAAFLTAPKVPDVFCDKTVQPCEPVSVNRPSEPEKLHCLDITQINEAIEATNF